MNSHFFAYISRMRFIQRWALMRNTAPENVQEHSHQVAVLAHALAVIRNERFGGQVDAGAVAVAGAVSRCQRNPHRRYADSHPSTIIPPSARRIRRWRRWRRISCSAFCRRICSRYISRFCARTPKRRRWVKAADKLSAYIKCVEELKAGNNEFRDAATQTRAALEGYGLPEVAYFMETFLHSFSLTLDQLK